MQQKKYSSSSYGTPGQGVAVGPKVHWTVPPSLHVLFHPAENWLSEMPHSRPAVLPTQHVPCSKGYSFGVRMAFQKASYLYVTFFLETVVQLVLA